MFKVCSHICIQLQQMLCKSKIVYILLHAFVTPGLNIHHSSTECYTGSTIHTLHDRQNTRQRKLRQLQRTQLVSWELALHWLCSQINYHQFGASPLICTNTTLQNTTDTNLRKLPYPTMKRRSTSKHRGQRRSTKRPHTRYTSQHRYITPRHRRHASQHRSCRRQHQSPTVRSRSHHWPGTRHRTTSLR